METVLVIVMLGCLLVTFVLYATYIVFRLDSHKRAIDKLIEKQIFDEKIKNQKSGKNGRPITSNVPINLEIESYFK